MGVGITSSLRFSDEESRLHTLFKADALDDVGLTGHPRADAAYNYAWEKGHSAGYSEVYSNLVDIAEVLIGD